MLAMNKFTSEKQESRCFLFAFPPLSCLAASVTFCSLWRMSPSADHTGASAGMKLRSSVNGFVCLPVAA